MVRRPSPPLSGRERGVIAECHRILFRHWNDHARRWLGTPILKYPQDLFLYQMILCERRPDVIVETGTNAGGSALFFATIAELLGVGHIVTIDRRVFPRRPVHPRITYLTGDTVDPAMVAQVRDLVGDRSCMVVLDSNHQSAHVTKELDAYAPMVTLGQFLVVEDTQLGTLVSWNESPDSPLIAAQAFLATHPGFVVRPFEDRFLISQCAGGWLQRVA